MKENNDKPQVSLRVYGCPPSVVLDTNIKEMMSDWAFRQLLTIEVYHAMEEVEEEAIVIVEKGVDSVSCTKKVFIANWNALRTGTVTPTPWKRPEKQVEIYQPPTELPKENSVEETIFTCHGFMQPLCLRDVELVRTAFTEAKYIEFVSDIVNSNPHRLLAFAFYLNRPEITHHADYGHVAQLMLHYVVFLLLNRQPFSDGDVLLVTGCLARQARDELVTHRNHAYDQLAEPDFVKSQEMSVPYRILIKMCDQAIKQLDEQKTDE